jgi:carbonic anhydrase
VVELEQVKGSRPPFTLGAYSDVDQSVRETMATLQASPFLEKIEIRGFVFNVDDGDLREISEL